MYALGVDLGTVFTAAAIWLDARAEIVSLGSRAATIPSVVLQREDLSFVIGEAANRRALLEPSRVAREFKRRFGDSTPIMLGGTPHSVQDLMGRLLGGVVAEVADQQGEPPAVLCVCHPATWGPYKTGLLQQAVRVADLGMPVMLAVEPVAAAAYYSRQQRIDTGAFIAVYDLGGGTFDAAVVRKTGEATFEIVGHPEGLEHLGGADFDAAVYQHVRNIVGEPLTELDDSLSTAIAAVARLREECTAAKETLSVDTDTTIPVLLPNFATEVRLTRGELERMVRPALYDTITSLQRAVRSARITPGDLHSVLLIGGSSRMPLVAQLVAGEMERPVAVDAHPKHAVALGAAWIAGTGQQRHAASAPDRTPGPAAGTPAMAGVGVGDSNGPGSEWARLGDVPPRGPGGTDLAATADVAATSEVAPAWDRAEADTHRAATPDRAAGQPAALGPGGAGPAAAGGPGSAGPVPGPEPPTVPVPAPTPVPPPAFLAAAPRPPVPASADSDRDLDAGHPERSSSPAKPVWARTGFVATAVAAAVLLVSAAVLVGTKILGGSPSIRSAMPAATVANRPSRSPSGSLTATASATAGASPTDLLRVCPTDADAVRWGCLISARRSGGTVSFTFRSNFTPVDVDDASHYHLHLFLANPAANGTTTPVDTTMQMGPNELTWYNLYNPHATTLAQTEIWGLKQPPDPTKFSLLCIRAANGIHGLTFDRHGGHRTGNCVKLST